MSNVLDYLNSKGIQYKLDGAEAILKCPQCNKDKLYLNINTEIYHCFVCEAEQPSSVLAKGHLSKLKEYYGDIVSISTVQPVKKLQSNFSIQVNRYHNNLLQNKKALKYLIIERGITYESIERFKLGFIRMEEQDWISIPAFKDEIPVFIKYRKLPPDTRPDLEKCRREKDGESILLNHDALKDYNEIYLCEGELDAITLIQNGYENTVGTTVGAGTLKPDWYEQLIIKEKLYICFDADDAGQKAARDIWATRLGIGKCWNVELPKGEDVNSFFLTHDKEDFDKLVLKASQFKIKGIKSIGEVFIEMYRRSRTIKDETFRLPWEPVNKLLGGGLRCGRLTVLGAYPGTGKTSMAIQICNHFATTYNMPCLIFCMEMPEVTLATKIVQLHLDLTDKEVRYDDGLVYLHELGELPIYFGYSSKITPTIFYNTMKEVRDRYGVQFGVFDNLQRMIRSGDESDMARASGMFKDLTLDLNIPFLLISQPRKADKETMNTSITYEELKGSSAIPADSDEVILLHRRKLTLPGKDKDETASEAYSSKTKVIVDKSRFSSGGSCFLEMIGEKSKFIEWSN